MPTHSFNIMEIDARVMDNRYKFRILSEEGRIMSLAEALNRLDTAIVSLERTSVRRVELDRRGGDLPTELALMQDDRARLAVELDGTLARLGQLEAVVSSIDERLAAALGKVEDVLAGERGN